MQTGWSAQAQDCVTQDAHATCPALAHARRGGERGSSARTFAQEAHEMTKLAKGERAARVHIEAVPERMQACIG